MATTKLTLSSDTDTIIIAKRIASENNISLSKLFKNLIIELDKKGKKDPLAEKLDAGAPDWLKQLIIAKEPTPDFDHKAEYHKHLEEKYGL